MMLTKGVKYDGGKPRVSLLPPLATLEVAKVLTFGALKYAPGNWKIVENGPERYLDASLRHIYAYMSDEKNDPETSLSHLAHAICCLMFILDIETKTQKEKNENLPRND